MAISETHGRADNPSEVDPIAGYHVWNSNRGGSDKGGGGLTLLYKESLAAHAYKPVVPANLEYLVNERQWLLISSGNDRIAFLHVYIACQNSRSDSFIAWNEDLFFLITQECLRLKQQGFTVLAMGDFNSRVGVLPGLEGNTADHNHNTPKFLTFLNEVNLLIINTLPVAKGLFTRFMDSSGRPGTKSLLDFGLIDHDKANTVTSFVIDEEARFESGSDHAVLECTIEFSNVPKVMWSIQEPLHYDIRDTSCYNDYQDALDDVVASVPFSEFSNQPASQMLSHVSESINAAAKKSFGLKVARKKKGRKLPATVINLIKEKNILARQLRDMAQGSHQPQHQHLKEQLDKLRTGIKDGISHFKMQRRTNLRSRLLLADPTRKKFWRFLKGQIKSAGQVSALSKKTGEMVFDQSQIEEAVLEHFEQIFKAKRVPIYPTEAPVDQVAIVCQEIEQMLCEHSPTFDSNHFEEKVCAPYSFVELSQILQKLPSGKASGYDR